MFALVSRNNLALQWALCFNVYREKGGLLDNRFLSLLQALEKEKNHPPWRSRGTAAEANDASKCV